MFKRRVTVINIIIITILMLGTMTEAKSGSSFKATVEETQSTIKPGETVTISVNVSDINMGTNGINTLEGKIEYDKTIFEEVKSSNVQSFSNWTTTYNDESSTLNGKFLAVNLSAGVKENTKIFSVTFKAKQDISKTISTQIKFNEITSNDGTDLVSAGSKIVNITVDTGNEVVEKPTNNSNEKNNNTIINSNKNTINTISSDKTQSKTILPKAGVGRTLAIILAIGIIAVLGLGVKNKTMKDIK